jgi:hypothetical protein
MLKLVVCIKQVPMVSELPWNPKTGTLKRELADKKPAKLQDYSDHHGSAHGGGSPL